MATPKKRKPTSKRTRVEMNEPSPGDKNETEAGKDEVPSNNSERQVRSRQQTRSTSEVGETEHQESSVRQSNEDAVQPQPAEPSLSRQHNITSAQTSEQHQSPDESLMHSRRPAAGPQTGASRTALHAPIAAIQPQGGESARQAAAAPQSTNHPPQSAAAPGESKMPDSSRNKRKATKSPSPPRSASVPPERRKQAPSRRPSHPVSDAGIRTAARASAPHFLPSQNVTPAPNNVLSTTAGAAPLTQRTQPDAANNTATVQGASQTAQRVGAAPGSQQNAAHGERATNAPQQAQQVQPQQGQQLPPHRQQDPPAGSTQQQPQPGSLGQQQAAQPNAACFRVQAVYSVRVRCNFPHTGHVTDEPAIVFFSLAAAAFELQRKVRENVYMRNCEVRLVEKLLDGTENFRILPAQAPGGRGKVDAEIVQMAVADGVGEVVWRPRPDLQLQWNGTAYTAP